MEKKQSYEMCQIIDGYATDMFIFLDEDILGAETVAYIKSLSDEEYEQYTKAWVRIQRENEEWQKKYEERQSSKGVHYNPNIKTQIILDDEMKSPKNER